MFLLKSYESFVLHMLLFSSRSHLLSHIMSMITYLYDILQFCMEEKAWKKQKATYENMQVRALYLPVLNLLANCIHKTIISTHNQISSE